MKYIIRVLDTDLHQSLELDEMKFRELKQARECLTNALAIEEKYELLLSNYLDLEKECLNVTCEFMVREEINYSGSFNARLAINRRIVNLLTSAKLYIDQISQHLKVCVPDKDMGKQIKYLFSSEYDCFFEYRFMEVLRNHVQHQGLAVHDISYDRKMMLIEELKRREYKIKIFTQKSKIELNKRLKQKVINEMPDQVDLIHASRIYITSISNIHYSARKLIKDASDSSRYLIDEYISRYKKINNETSVGLNAISLSSTTSIIENKIVEKIPLFLNLDDIRISLINKNKMPISSGNKYICSS